MPKRRSLLAVSAGGLIALAATLGLAALLIGGKLRRQAMEQRLMTLERERLVERRLSDVAANLPGMIFRRVEDADGTVRYPYVSGGRDGPASVSLMTRAEAGGDELAQLIHPDDRAAWGAVFAVPADAEPSHLEVRTVPMARLMAGAMGERCAGFGSWRAHLRKPTPGEGGPGTVWRST